MKLGPRDVSSFLKAPDAQTSAVLLYGPDAGLVRERSRAIAAVILGKDSDPINRTELSFDHIKSDAALLRDELCALSLMGGRRLVVLQGAGDKTTPVIESALTGLATTTYLIVESGELASASSLRQFFEKQSTCAALACYHDEGRGLEDTLRGALAANGLRATTDAMQYLLAHLGNDRGVTHSEIGKIALYMGESKDVTLDDVMRLVGHNGSQSLEDICHAVACGHAQKTEALLGHLLQEGVQPVAVIRALLRHFQRLDLAHAHLRSGQTPEQALTSLRPPVFFKYVPSAKRALSLWNARTLTSVLTLLFKAEREIKSGRVAPPLITSHALQRAVQLIA